MVEESKAERGFRRFFISSTLNCHFHQLKIGCQTWTRTKTSGLTNRRATLTPPGNGAAGRIPTCIVPFRRRMPHVFGHGSKLNAEMSEPLMKNLRYRLFGQRGRTCTCDPSVPSRACCCYTTLGAPAKVAGGLHLRSLGSRAVPATYALKLADPKGVAPSTFPQTTGCSAD